MVCKSFKMIDDKTFQKDPNKCHYANSEIEWSGYRIKLMGAEPLKNETDAILAVKLKKYPRTLKKLTFS